MKRFREWLAFKIAPWVYVPHRERREEAFKQLAEIAYGSRDAIWTSPTVLVESALRRTREIAWLEAALAASPALGAAAMNLATDRPPR